MQKHWLIVALVATVVVTATTVPMLPVIGLAIAGLGIVAGAFARLRTMRSRRAAVAAGVIVGAGMVAAGMGWLPEDPALLLGFVGLPGFVASTLIYACAFLVASDVLGARPVDALVATAVCGIYWLVNTAALAAIFTFAARARARPRAKPRAAT